MTIFQPQIFPPIFEKGTVKLALTSKNEVFDKELSQDRYKTFFNSAIALRYYLKA
jgi:hypothetical protein